MHAARPDSGFYLNAAPVGAAGEAGRQVGDAVGAAHGADGGGEAVALTDALGVQNPVFTQGPALRRGDGELRVTTAAAAAGCRREINK